MKYEGYDILQEAKLKNKFLVGIGALDFFNPRRYFSKKMLPIQDQ